MTKTLSMLLRAYHFVRINDPSYSNRLGSFSVASSKCQLEATRTLYRYLISAGDKSEEEFDDQSIKLVHELLVSLVHHDIHGTRKMECPTDQSLFLLSLRRSPQGTLQFQTANRLTHDCATLQYWFFTIVTHIARLEADGKDNFVFFSYDHQAIAEVIGSPEEAATVILDACEGENRDGNEDDEEEKEEEEDADEAEEVTEGSSTTNVLK